MMQSSRLNLNNLPIRYKLVVHFLLISILPSLGIGLLVSWTADRIIGEQITDNTLQLISNVNRALDNYAGNMQNITYFVAFNADVKRFLEGSSQVAARMPGEDEHYDIKQFLQGFSNLYPEIAGILVANSRGDYISNELYARRPAPLMEEGWYQRAVEKKGIFTIIGHPAGRNLISHYDYQENELVSMARAVLDPETQRVQGVVLIDLKLRVIAEAAKDVRLGKSGYLTVMDEVGEMIYAPARPFVGEIPVQWLEDNPSGHFSRAVGGERLQFIFRQSTFTGWTTVGVFPTSDVAAKVRELRMYAVSLAFIVCLLGISASLYLSHTISRPIGQLMSFMRKAEAGDLTVRYWGSRLDEVGQLGRSYNTMLAQMSRLITLTELQERQKREAELRSLQAHIKPHFLYNTLETIQWLARRKGAEDVAEVVDALSSLFRIGLSGGNDRIALVEEFEHIRSYLTIQQTRYRGKLHASIQISEEVQDVYVLKLLLQPLVENAIYHGIKSRRGPGRIWVKAELQESRLVLTVQDDGAGMEKEQLERLRARLQRSVEDQEREERGTGGYGLHNVQARINLTFGDPYGLRVESERGGGTLIQIIHPVLRITESKPLASETERGKRQWDDSGRC